MVVLKFKETIWKTDESNWINRRAYGEVAPRFPLSLHAGSFFPL